MVPCRSLLALSFLWIVHRPLVDCAVTVEVRFISYYIPSGHKWDDKNCDSWGSKCDPTFEISFYEYEGSKLYAKKSTNDDWNDDNTLNFGSDMKGIANPVVFHITDYKGGFRFKSEVEDEDFLSSDDLIDKFDVSLRFDPARSKSESTEVASPVQGLRSKKKTTFLLKIRVYCKTNYYGSDCTVYCLAKNSEEEGRYTCDPYTGEKICRRGYEGLDCTIFADDCRGQNCGNGVCVDGNRTHMCQCNAGFTGQTCEVNIDECDSSPCKNQGTCMDRVNGFECACSSEYIGDTCQLHVCNSSVSNPCSTPGGRCYYNTATRTAMCACAEGFTGSICDVRLCDLESLQCVNGFCNLNHCVCTMYYTGTLCEIRKCDQMVCHNGGRCEVDKCVCPLGFKGGYCETNIDDCENEPCLNEGTCLDGNNTYTCRCLPDYSGPNCGVKADDQNVAGSQNTTINHSVENKYVTVDISPWIYVAIVVGFIIIVLIVIFVCLRRRRRMKDADHSVQTQSSIEENLVNSRGRTNNVYETSVDDSPGGAAISATGASGKSPAFFGADDVFCKGSPPPYWQHEAEPTYDIPAQKSPVPARIDLHSDQQVASAGNPYELETPVPRYDVPEPVYDNIARVAATRKLFEKMSEA